MGESNAVVHPHGGGGEKKRLSALTSLRFFAAALVVYHHAQTYLWLPPLDWVPVVNQGVSIFFVLSGFILTYVYPKLDGWYAVRNFFRARFARIWPAYLASIVIAIIISPRLVTEPDGAILFGRIVTNALALQSWSPAGEIFYSMNGPSWSVSTEVFFYALFPLLILGFARTWWLKLLGSFALVVLIITAILRFNIPGYGPGLEYSINSYALLYINPYARVFEFVCGMCAAWAWRRFSLLDSTPYLFVTILEIAALCVLVFNSVIAGAIFSLFPFLRSEPSAMWFAQAGGSALPAAIFIVVLASDRGILSKLMSASWLVLLGELSYSIYLLHYPLLQLFSRSIPRVADQVNWSSIALYLAALFLLTHLVWVLIERPLREMLVGSRGHSVQSTRTGLLNPSWTPAAVDGALLFVVLTFVLANAALPSPVSAKAERAIVDTPSEIRGARFGSLAKLQGYYFAARGDGATLHLVWKALGRIDRSTSFAVHLLAEPEGSIVAQGDYAGRFLATKKQQRFEDAIVLSNAQLAGACYVGVGLYPTGTGNLVPVGRGPRDWGGRRLLIPVPSSLNTGCATATIE